MTEEKPLYFIHNRLTPGWRSHDFVTYASALAQVRDDFRMGSITGVEIMRHRQRRGPRPDRRIGR
jgi:hypothetical protein